MSTWQFLPPIQATQYYIPKEIAFDPKNIFYVHFENHKTESNKERKSTKMGTDTEYKLLGLIKDDLHPEIVNVHLGKFTTAELFDLYSYEILKVEEFNILDILHGHLDLSHDLNLSLISILENYASKMPKTDYYTHTFELLSQEEKNKYQIARTDKIYQYSSHPPQYNYYGDLITLISFNNGIEILQFPQDIFTKNPQFNIQNHSRGHIKLTRNALMEFTSMIKEKK